MTYRNEHHTSGPQAGWKLHLGCGGKYFEGYINIDGFDDDHRPGGNSVAADLILNATDLERWFEPGSVEEIRTHHMFEHISVLDVHAVLLSWRRLLVEGGLLWIETPDFESCARRILELDDEEAKEVYYRHIFGSQFGSGEYHLNGLTVSRLSHLLGKYGFDITETEKDEAALEPVDPIFLYPTNPPLPNLTVKAVKKTPEGWAPPSGRLTTLIYREIYPVPAVSLPFGVRARNLWQWHVGRRVRNLRRRAGRALR